MTEELKPCPFCGSTNVWIEDNCEFGAYIVCGECNCTSGLSTPGKAIESWNTRQEPIPEWLVDKLNDWIAGYKKHRDIFHGLSSPRPEFAIEELERVLTLIKPNTECPVCHGAGSLENSSRSPNCKGTGNEHEEIPEWLKTAIEKIQSDYLNWDYHDWEYAIYSNSEQFGRIKSEINNILNRILYLKKPEDSP